MATSTTTSAPGEAAVAVAVATTSSDNNNTLVLLQELRQKVEASLLPSLESHAQQFAPNEGFDFLQVKNSLLVSYLIDLTLLLRQQQQHKQQKQAQEEDDDDDDEEHADKADAAAEQQQNWQRLTEMKVTLDKMMRGLDKKLRYQLDKVLQASSSATTFSAADPTMQPNSNDPLQYRPHIDDEGEDDDGRGNHNGTNNNSDDSGDEDGDDDDDDLAMARATVAKARQGRGESAKPANNKNTEKKNHPKRNGHDDDDDHQGEQDGLSLYRAPRLASVPYTLDQEDRHVEKEQRRKRRLRASEVAQTLRAQYGDAPEQDDVHGGTDFGKQREAARRLAEREAEKTKYEENAMVRLVTTRQEKKDRRRVLRQEGSNLAAIADLGNLVRDARLDRDDDDDDHNNDERNDRRMDKRNNKKGTPHGGESERYANGKRNKRMHQDTMEEGNRFATTKRKGKGVRPKNSLQANLYGGGGGGSGSNNGKRSNSNSNNKHQNSNKKQRSHR